MKIIAKVIMIGGERKGRIGVAASCCRCCSRDLLLSAGGSSKCSVPRSVPRTTVCTDSASGRVQSAWTVTVAEAAVIGWVASEDPFCFGCRGQQAADCCRGCCLLRRLLSATAAMDATFGNGGKLWSASAACQFAAPN